MSISSKSLNHFCSTPNKVISHRFTTNELALNLENNKYNEIYKA